MDTEAVQPATPPAALTAPLPESGPAPLAPPSEAPPRVAVAGHELTVFAEWPPLRDALLRDIAAAKTRIWVEVYIFQDDAGGTALAEALKERARAGLDVRLLYDALGSQATPAAFFADLAAAGIQVHAYHTLGEAFRRFRPFTLFNRRDHRKLVVIDDALGYFGGMNLIDNTPAETADEARKLLPASAGWRDIHLRLAGPQQCELAESFDRSWRRAHHQHVPRRPRAYRRARLPGEGGGEESIRFFDSGPGLKFSRAARVFSRLLRRARHEVLISMAYFVPVGRVLRALLAARRRGVRCRVIIPGRSDVAIVQRATAYLYGKLLRRGFRLYERQDRMLHSKMMVVDGQWTLVGSCNLDPRSLFVNLEFLAVIRSRALARIMADIARDEIRASVRITPEHCRRATWYDRWLNELAWSLRWWL